MTPMKWTLLGIVVVIAVLLGLNGYYRYVQAPLWTAERQAEKKAEETGQLKDATAAWKFVWDETVWVVNGKDRDGDNAYVWLTAAPFKLKESEGLTKQQMKERFLQAVPDADLHHIEIGIIGNQPIWEVFYSRGDSSAGNNYYNFYRFQDGAFIVTYTLPA